MGGMGGGMMGGMGGGMMGGMGGRGGGFRAIPPTDLAGATLRPGQARNLPTRLVSLSPPSDAAKVVLPQKGEPLELGDISQLDDLDPRIRRAMERLAAEKAPETVSQLVLWHLRYGLDWPTLAQVARGWANTYELALARQFVAKLEDGGLPRKDRDETGTLYLGLAAQGADHEALMAELHKLLEKHGVLGLTVKADVPSRPKGPALACKVEVVKNEAVVLVSTSDQTGGAWKAMGKFTLPLDRGEKGELKLKPAEEVADAMAEGILGRLVRAQLTKGQKVKGKDTYKIGIDNASPLVLNGLMLSGMDRDEETKPSALAGFSLPPHKHMSMPATGEMVDRLGLKKGIRVLAADLSGL
jgi:hypothetical protein